jgi:Bacterial membrane protein YfhO
MSKQPGKRISDKKAVQEKPIVPQKYETPILVALILVLLVVFLHKAFFENQVFISVDINASKSLDGFIQQAKSEGVFPLWIPYIFGGMPSFASLLTAGNRWYDLVVTVWGAVDHFLSVVMVNSSVGWVVVYYWLFGFGIFLLGRRLGLTKFASFFAAVATIFSTFIIDWIMAGHNTKIAAISFFPFILLLVMELTRRFKWSYLLGLIVAIHLQFSSTHIQMIFYSFLALAIYLIYMLVRGLVKKDNLAGIVRSGLLLVAASAIAFAMSADVYLSTYQYSKYSIRGAPPIAQTVQDKAAPGGGLDYQYATNWSFSPAEIMSLLIPSYYGFGDIEYSGPLSNNQTVHVNTYFGPEPFMEASPYMGVIVILLAFVGVVRNRKNPFVIFSLIVIAVAFLISFGREFSLVYDLMFNYFPYFNKFRSPNMILILVQIFVPILAAFGLNSIAEARLNSDHALARKMLISAGVFGGLILLALIMQGPFQDFYNGVIQSGRFAKSPQQVQQLLFDNMATDLYVSLFICMLTAAVAAFYIRGRVTTLVAGAGFTFLLLLDLWRIDYRPMQMYDRKTQAEQFTTPDYVNFIKQDTGIYRVIQLQNDQPATSNDLAYYLVQDAGGYSAAKIRIYQDMIDVDGLTNPNIMKLMGIKYVITDKPEPVYGKVAFTGSRSVEENQNILPRAFFVHDYKVASGLGILNTLRESAFDPAKTAYFLEDPGLKVDPPDTGASVSFEDYKLQSMKMRVRATGNNLLLLSEVYYPAGWNAYIDGNPTKIFRADYFLRAIAVPKGEHEIVLKFEPGMYSLGKTLSLGSNGLVLLFLIGLLPSALAKMRKPSRAVEGAQSQTGKEEKA